MPKLPVTPAIPELGENESSKTVQRIKASRRRAAEYREKLKEAEADAKRFRAEDGGVDPARQMCVDHYKDSIKHEEETLAFLERILKLER